MQAVASAAASLVGPSTAVFASDWLDLGGSVQTRWVASQHAQTDVGLVAKRPPNGGIIGP